MLWNRKYPPIKSKSPIIMAMMMAISIIWFVGDLQANGHVPLAGTPMTNCKAFGLWMRILLGVCSLCALTTLRAYGLYRLGLYLPLHLLSLPNYFGIVFQVLKPEITTMYIAALDLCNLHTLYKAILFTLLALTWLILVFIHWKIRSIKSSFNESREISLGQLLFNRQRYLENWINKLRKDGLQRMYEFDPDTFVTNGRESLLLTNTVLGKTDEQFYPVQDSIYGYKDADSSYKSNLDYPMNS
ncbi:hypothetical protein BX661DRAFT_186724 [Kickxella alabastrina]|uniref:uncharacterized protein n=1 Tax=Kickxella alabastrina TaxID=61397 RepID=UPI00221F0B90|nr:uncharacterized protein BX661DRAFT_186724 [Kickxella alabastrina]KAI7823490.1 hypothetical protein BX661DRAFT_186724 [Kickxella alabastrina]